MIVSYRTYEANAKALQSQDQTLDHLFGKVAGLSR
jgi:flagellar basal body rod protein FlgG